jgi:hypothetical protein
MMDFPQWVVGQTVFAPQYTPQLLTPIRKQAPANLLKNN